MRSKEVEAKYITFKASEFREACLQRRERSDIPASEVLLDVAHLDDAVVIRQKDIFAGTALHAYSAAVQNAVEIMEGLGARVPDYLYDLRDDFAELAEGADAHKAKRLPD